VTTRSSLPAIATAIAGAGVCAPSLRRRFRGRSHVAQRSHCVAQGRRYAPSPHPSHLRRPP
jgi:hypothetical protein